MPSAFPEPKVGNVTRPFGDGCVSCIHKRYCDSFRYLIFFGTKLDGNYGRACLSWSTNPNDLITQWTEDDMIKEEYNYNNDFEQWETPLFTNPNMGEL